MTVQSLFLGKLIMKTKTGSLSIFFFCSFFSDIFFSIKRDFILLLGILKSGYFLIYNYDESLPIVMENALSYFNS